ncbi:MAG: TolC family protein [Acidobacteria bacterium]|nr:TolC family protein [Thermoanaerobaculia bacterium]NLN11606.1 TolC family protein [Acidobacteriota bacterium]MBP7813333.1 TolC family protein [Thermoanaerobaculia bacterium]HPA95539.1 TolC family protein [Thermoanaerobaculia bacterium]HQN38970.1 TolC family protein [Thermoanaerobaculia bacterium]
MSRRTPTTLVCLILALHAAASVVSAAQKPPPEPPRLSFDEGRIGLFEAVRLTLAHDPNLLLQQEDVRFREGLLAEIAGAFDWNLAADLSYQHQEQELRDSVIQAEQDKRDTLSVQNEFYCTQVPRQDDKIARLEGALAGQPIVPGEFDENTDGFFLAQLRYYQELLQNAQTPQERDAILRSRTALLNRELAVARETRKQYAAICNDTAEALARLGKVPEFEEFDSGKLSLRFSKLFRSGVGFSPFLTGSYDHTQYLGKKNGYYTDRLDADGNPTYTEWGTPLQRFVDYGGKNIEDLYRAQIGFDINVPLLRGGGVETVGAPEKAATVDLEASELALQHGAAVSVLNTTVAYWQLLAAQEQVAILERSVALREQLVELTDQLIAGDVLPRVERSRSLAGVANARSQLEAARRDLVSARMALARSMGVDVESEAAAPFAEGPFPAAPEVESVLSLDSARLAEESLRRRADRASTWRLVESGKVLAEAARRELRDRFDVALSLHAGALGEKSFSNAVDRWTGPSGQIAFAFEKELGNRTARGRYDQNLSLVRQRQISAADLDRTIRIAIVGTLHSLAESIARLAEAEAAAGFYQETIDAELEKLRIGASTLIDVILTEQQRTSADLAVLSARHQVATLLARLRYETGTLIAPAATGGNVLAFDDLVTLPELAAGGRP